LINEKARRESVIFKFILINEVSIVYLLSVT